MMPPFTAGYCGAKNVGANYGIILTAWGVWGFTVAKYFVSIVPTAIVKRPVREVGGGEQRSYKQL